MRGAFWAVLGLMGLLSAAMPAFAQDGGPPPLPMVFQGEVYVDGELLAKPAELTVRVGDWESRPVTVVNGRFQSLLAGPNQQRYIGQPVTFHLNGEHQAAQTLDFPALGTPAFETIQLYFGETPAAGTGSWLLWGALAAAVLLALLAGGAWYLKGRGRAPAPGIRGPASSRTGRPASRRA